MLSNTGASLPSLLLAITAQAHDWPSTIGTTVAGQGSASDLPRIVDVPGYGTIYVAPPRPQDTRTDRQRCIDAQVATQGGKVSALAMATIDLQCSQR